MFLRSFFYWREMQVINKLNNNFAICIDGEGKELIVSVKVLDFPKLHMRLKTELDHTDILRY